MNDNKLIIRETLTQSRETYRKNSPWKWGKRKRRQWYLEEIASLGCGPELPSEKDGGGFLQLVQWLAIQRPHLRQSWFRQDSKWECFFHPCLSSPSLGAQACVMGLDFPRQNSGGCFWKAKHKGNTHSVLHGADLLPLPLCLLPAVCFWVTVSLADGVKPRDGFDLGVFIARK